jgi:drug/metabolite transporter (DMT)-like permease
LLPGSQPDARTPLSVHLILVLAQVCFASLPVAGRLAMKGSIGPAGIVLARMVGGAIVFALIAWRVGVLRIERRDVPALIGCSLIGVAANQELFVQGLSRSTATNATVLGSTIPVFTALIAILLRREPPRPRRLVGIAVAFAGVAAFVGVDQMSMSSGHLAGSVMVLINSLCYGTYLVVVRPLAAKYHPLGLLAWLFIFGVPMVAPLGVVELAHAPALHASDIEFFAFLIAFPTVAAYGLVQVALRRTESSLVAAYIYLQPVLATVGAMLLLDEQPTIRTAICGAIVLFGVWLAARRAR